MVRIIAVVSDFANDYYHGVMKGIISTLDNINFIDLPIRHHQSIINTAWILRNSVPYFPKETVFLVVVDPGVGSDRKGLAIQTSQNWFVLPDNGIITPFIGDIQSVYKLPTEESKSSTFHGRDVFAPAVVNIIENDLQKFEKITKQELKINQKLLNNIETEGMITDIDSFGNIITNIRPPELRDELKLLVGNNKITLPLVDNFSELEMGNMGLIIGSCNTIEIVRNQASAIDNFNDFSVGTPIKLVD